MTTSKLATHPDENKLYQRLFVSIEDFSFARSFANHLLKKGWHSFPWERRGSIYMQQAAFTTALVTSYARPFTQSKGWPKLPPELVPYNTTEAQLHEQIIELRHQVYAHSDSSRYSIRPIKILDFDTDIVGAPHLRLSKEETEMIIIMIDNVVAKIRSEIDRLRKIVGEEPNNPSEVYESSQTSSSRWMIRHIVE